jgi:hypothetical protein
VSSHFGHADPQITLKGLLTDTENEDGFDFRLTGMILNANKPAVDQMDTFGHFQKVELEETAVNS